MKKSFGYYIAIWFIAFLAFNLLCFLTPSTIEGKSILEVLSIISYFKPEIIKGVTVDLLYRMGLSEITFYKYGGAFWASYAAIAVAFIGQLYFGFVACRDNDNQKLFYRFPIIVFSYISLLLTMIAGVACMLIPNMPLGLGAAICFGILLLTATTVLKAQAASSIAISKDKKLQDRTSRMHRFVALAEASYKSELDPLKKEDYKKIYEALKYSDPISNGDTEDIENEIEKNLENVDVVLTLIAKRNAICKASK